MRNWKKTALSTLAVIVALLVVLVAPAGAAGNTQFSAVGMYAPAGECTQMASFVTMKVTGDLVGCWYTPVLEPVQTTPSGVYRERGEETFVGCLADGTTCGTINATYQFEAKFDASGAELFGRCQHPFVSGTGDFEGITGEVFMKDNVQTGEFYIRGHFALP